MITGKIDVSKIKKEKLFKGEKGTYLDFVLWETKDDKYGNDYLVKQSGDKGEEMQILGSAKIHRPKAESVKNITKTTDDGLPF